jgi:hypothetical protein
VTVPLVLLFAGSGALFAEDTGTISASAHTMGDDALWMGHGWVGGQETQADLNALVARLRTTGIRDLFVHSGPLSDNGSLNPALLPRARWLIGSLHQALPRVRVQAWLGDLVGAGHMDLADAATRARVVQSVRQVLADGFDGVHLDLEPVPSGNSAYLTLLSQVHAVTRSMRRLLSVSVPQVEPLPAMHLLNDSHWWSAGYLHQVAQQVDEVAVMTYDTGVPTEGLYSGYVRRETQVALSAVPPGVTLLIGAPAYNSSSVGHFNSAETVAAAVRGVRLAISPDPPRRPLGIALYVDFTATAQDWNQYLTGWVRP